MRSPFAIREFTACLLAALAAACGSSPKVGEVQSGATYGPGIRIEITGASVGAGGRVVASYTLSKDGQGMTGAVAARMQPAWTLAGLSTDPVSKLPWWKSYLLIGNARIPQLPVAGPGTQPEQVLYDTRQPGPDVDGTIQDLGDGRFTYTFATPLPEGFLASPGASETMRVGVWLRGAPGTRTTTSTFDFVPDGVTPLQSRELVVDVDCENCHGIRQGHSESRTGTKICLTCHTIQHADPDTIDPAAMAMSPGTATIATNPNPLEFGRLVHRIHRGRQLPTLYLSSSTALAQVLPPSTTPALPFLSSRNAALVGQKYSVIDDELGEQVFAQVWTRPNDTRSLPTGIFFPQDYRNCDVCHGGAAQHDEIWTDTARRTCHGCHPDVWYGTGTPDKVHFAHTGGPQPDDTKCAGCHVSLAPGAPATCTPQTCWVPHQDAHSVPYKSPYYNLPTVKVVGVQGAVKNGTPTVTLAIADLVGPLSSINKPAPAKDNRPTTPSPVPRAFTSGLSMTLVGPASDYKTGNFITATTDPVPLAPISETMPATTVGVANAQFGYTFKYTFKSALPPDASGTWAIGISLRRSLTSTVYDFTAGKFIWPFTGESLGETSDNVIVYLDTAVGSGAADANGVFVADGNPQPRRMAADVNNCNKCHIRLALHGGPRNKVEYCILCHAPETTDWKRRTKDASGQVLLSATHDNKEETTVQFKVLMHRIHTGGRKGRAQLERMQPYVVYGNSGGTKPYYFDDIRFPNKIINCRLCHSGEAFYVETVERLSVLPTVVNETASVLHLSPGGGVLATATHPATDPRIPPLQAACTGCHDTVIAAAHCNEYTSGGVESCSPCHAAGQTLSVTAVHGLGP